MPGFELIGEEERREVLQVLDSGVLMRDGFDAARNGQWKSRELETAHQPREDPLVIREDVRPLTACRYSSMTPLPVHGGSEAA